MRYIGSVAIPTVQEVTFSFEKENSEVDLIDKNTNILFHGSEGGVGIDISFTLVKSLHPQEEPIEQQEKDVKSLVSNDVDSNTFVYNGIEGVISVESVDIPNEGSADTIREGTLSGLFFPWPKNYPSVTIVAKGEYGYGAYGYDEYEG